MINPPLTKEEAAKVRYGTDSGIKRSAPYKPERCAMEISEPPYYIRNFQCSRKPGHGPDGLYCKQHAKKFEVEKHDRL